MSGIKNGKTQAAGEAVRSVSVSSDPVTSAGEKTASDGSPAEASAGASLNARAEGPLAVVIRTENMGRRETNQVNGTPTVIKNEKDGGGSGLGRVPRAALSVSVDTSEQVLPGDLNTNKESVETRDGSVNLENEHEGRVSAQTQGNDDKIDNGLPIPPENQTVTNGRNTVSRQETQDIPACRLPRILRVRIGSGRRLNKYIM